MSPDQSATQMHRLLGSSALEVAYEKSCREVEYVHSDENARRLRVQSMLLEVERGDLQQALEQRDDRVEELEAYVHELQRALGDTLSELNIAHGESRIKVREIETMKTELTSLRAVTMNSTNVLTEKLALARELSVLRPEVDHLRSQAASHQGLLADKLSLQRQVTTLQVELENEKRSVRRNIAEDSKQQDDDVRLESRVEKLQGDLNRERKERQKADREVQRICAESESKVNAAESRSDGFRNKLKNTKDLLKETRSELLSVRSTTNRASAHNTVATANPPTPRKRAAAQMDEVTMIGTPGDVRVVKRGRKVSSLVGEKSTFAITPFLNRTASMAPDSPPTPGWGQNYTEESTASKSHEITAAAVSEASSLVELGRTQKGMGIKKNTLELAQSSNLNSKAAPVRRAKSVVPHLEKVPEEENQQLMPNASPEPPSSVMIQKDTMMGGAQARRTKRKLLGLALGKTLFDDEEVDTQGSRGDIKGFGGTDRTGSGRLRLAALTSTFGAISPLKKDKRLGLT